MFLFLIELNKHYIMKTWRGIAPPVLASAHHIGVVSFTPQPLYPEESAPSTHLIGGSVGSRASLDAVMQKKFLSPARNRTPAVWPIFRRYPGSAKRNIPRAWSYGMWCCAVWFRRNIMPPSSSLTMEAVSSSKLSILQATPEDRSLNIHHRENLKSDTKTVFLPGI
jgi:hypothetical protein